jgi:hypothetical protein
MLSPPYLLSGTAPNVCGGGGGVDWLIVSWIKVIGEKGKLLLPPEF